MFFKSNSVRNPNLPEFIPSRALPWPQANFEALRRVPSPPIEIIISSEESFEEISTYNSSFKSSHIHNEALILNPSSERFL